MHHIHGGRHKNLKKGLSQVVCAESVAPIVSESHLHSVTKVTTPPLALDDSGFVPSASIRACVNVQIYGDAGLQMPGDVDETELSMSAFDKGFTNAYMFGF